MGASTLDAEELNAGVWEGIKKYRLEKMTLNEINILAITKVDTQLSKEKETPRTIKSC